MRTVRKIINTTESPKAIGAYNQAIQANRLLFISGQLGIEPKTRKIVQGGVTQVKNKIQIKFDLICKKIYILWKLN